MGWMDFFKPRSDGRAEPQSPMPIEPMALAEPAKPGISKSGIAVGSAIALVLGAIYANEGGYVNNKNDRGGETIYGVTVAVARAEGYTGPMRQFPKHCSATQPICADFIYTKRYIDRPGYRPMAAIEPAVLEELADSGVLHGPSRASGWFQQTLNQWCGAKLTVDKQVGPGTIGAYRACQTKLGKVAACRVVLNGMDAKQADFFRAIVANNPSQRVFLKGWLAHRINNVDRSKCGKGVA